MEVERSFPLQHGGYVFDMRLDHFGRRLATCSEDGKVKVFLKTNSKEGWKLGSELPECHKSDVTNVAWSHPEFSMLLASSSSDLSLVIWEEESENKWKWLFWDRTYKSHINSLEFGPKHLGLSLSIGFVDGNVINISPTDVTRKEWMITSRYKFEDDTWDVSSLSWNNFPYDSASMVVGSTIGKCATLWKMDNERKKWRNLGSMHHNAAVNHVAWAPNLGRSYHIIATASSDGTVKLWSIRSKSRNESTSSNNDDDSVIGDGQVDISLIQTLIHKGGNSMDSNQLCEVFRVEWNLTATMLSTSCDDGLVRLWSPNLKGEWQERMIAE